MSHELPDFPFAHQYLSVNGHRLAYVEEGAGAPLLLLHGNPTSSYTFRYVIEPLARATGRRVIALDLLGFGRSEKPRAKTSLRQHSDLILGFIEALDLRDIVLLAEDWGGFLGGHVMTRAPERFAAAVLMETFLWSMTWEDDFESSFVLPFKMMRSPVGDVFTRGFNMMVNKLIPEHCPITDEGLQVYRDALPTWADRRAMADFPRLLPLNGQPRQSYEVVDEIQAGLGRLDFPIAWLLPDPGVIVSHKNPIGHGRLDALRAQLPQIEVLDFGAGFHFLSEENPERVVELTVGFLRANDLVARLREESAA